MTRFQALREAAAKWRRRTRRERLLLLEAVALLGIARLTTLIFPFRWIAGSLGKHMAESSRDLSAAHLQQARTMGQAIRSAAKYTPWASVCLSQAVAAQWMLKRRRIPATLYLGVAKDKAKWEGLSAHAWLRCGNVILTGREEHGQFAVVTTFCSGTASATSVARQARAHPPSTNSAAPK